MDSIKNYELYPVIRQSEHIHEPIPAAGDSSTPTDQKISRRGKESIYLARNLPYSEDVLLYIDEPDYVTLYKHFNLGIGLIFTIIPRVIQATFLYLQKWWQGTPINPIDNPLHIAGHLLSLLRWNLVGLFMPTFARLHFGDEDRAEHIAEETFEGLTLDLQNSEDFIERNGEAINRFPCMTPKSKYPKSHLYFAPCFQPIMRVSPEKKINEYIRSVQDKPVEPVKVGPIGSAEPNIPPSVLASDEIMSDTPANNKVQTQIRFYKVVHIKPLPTNNYDTHLVTGLFFERTLSTSVHIATGSEDLGDDEGRAPQPTKRVLYQARNLAGTQDALLYQNDPDLLIRYKHFMLGIEMLIILIPRVVVASFIWLTKWFRKKQIKAVDTGLFHLAHHLSLLRWNIIGIVFPQYGRMHFGDEERKFQMMTGTLPTLTLDLQGNENRGLRTRGFNYYAPCFQPLMRVNAENGSDITNRHHKYHVVLEERPSNLCFA